MSIISDALKKARDARVERSPSGLVSRPVAPGSVPEPRSCVPSAPEPSARFEPKRRNSPRPLLAVVFIAVIGSLGLFALSLGGPSTAPVIESTRIALAPDVVPAVTPPPPRSLSTPEPEPAGETGSAQFTVEEREFLSRPQPPEFELSGIAQFQDHFVAVVNGRVIRAGDDIAGAKVIAIYADSVQMRSESGERIVLEKSF